MSREERGGRRRIGKAISGPAHRLMLSLRCVGLRLPAALPSSYRLARRGMEQRLGPGGLVVLKVSAQV